MGGPEEDLFVDNNHPQQRLNIRNELISFAQSFITRWDEFTDVTYVNEKYGYRFEARQTEHNNQIVTLCKAFVPGMTTE